MLNRTQTTFESFIKISPLLLLSACAHSQPATASDATEPLSAKRDSHLRHPASLAPECSAPQHSKAGVTPHQSVRTFMNQGNEIQALVTASTGSQQFEVWHSRVAPGGSTPPHTHSTDEVFIVLSGEGEVRVGAQIYPFKAPATIVAPAHTEHQLTNTGSIPTEQYVIVGACSAIHDHEGQIMDLPWRK